MSAHADLESWNPDLVRELLVIVYGGHRDGDEVWHPDLAAVARRRKVSQRTVQRWIATSRTGGVGIPQAQLDAILARRRTQRGTMTRERLALREIERKIARADLGRRRGNLVEYAPLGWLDEHVLIILEDKDRPLRRPVVTRNTVATRTRAARGSRIVDAMITDTKFTAERWRFALLDSVTPWRLQLPTRKVSEGHTQVWLSSAPVTDLPLRSSADA